MTRVKGTTSTEMPLAKAPLCLDSLGKSFVGMEWGTTHNRFSFVLKSETFKKLTAIKETDGCMVHSMRSRGSAVLNLAAVAAGQTHCYQEGGCWAWDVFAGCCILNEAGGIMINGNPVSTVFEDGKHHLIDRRRLTRVCGSLWW